jgi:NADPH:quinone reductase
MTITMRAVFAARPGGPDVLELRRVPRPEPGPAEVLIRVEAAGVNRPDLRQRAGGYPPPPGITEILGLEVAGTVAGTGPGVDPARIGEPICALLAGGGYAEFCVAPVEQVLPRPAGLDAIAAAALPETYFTVWTNLFEIGRLEQGDTVLVHGGASGIGTTAIQLARAFGARPVATAGSPEKCAACLRLGAAAALDYKREDWAARVRELTDGRGADVILDMVCADYAARNLSCLAFDGRLVVIAFLGGGKAEIDIEAMVRKRQFLTGSTLRPQSPARKGRIAAALRERVWPLIERRAVAPVIQSVHPLEHAAAAHAELEAGGHVGKIMLSVG